MNPSVNRSMFFALISKWRCKALFYRNSFFVSAVFHSALYGGEIPFSLHIKNHIVFAYYNRDAKYLFSVKLFSSVFIFLVMV